MRDMKNPKSSQIAAFQALIFEMNWPSFRWIEYIFHREDDENVFLLVQHSPQKTASAQNECNAMFREIFAAAYVDSFKKLSVEYQLKTVVQPGWFELMSDQTFKQLAREIAPWRIETGR
jgi:hypothetical protein